MIPETYTVFGSPSVYEMLSFVVVVQSAVSNSATPWTVARQAPLAMAFSRQEYWSELSFPPPGDLPDPGIKPMSLGRQVLYHSCHLQQICPNSHN